MSVLQDFVFEMSHEEFISGIMLPLKLDQARVSLLEWVLSCIMRPAYESRAMNSIPINDLLDDEPGFMGYRKARNYVRNLNVMRFS